MKLSDLCRLPWLDVEASSLRPNSYPIEVGYTLPVSGSDGVLINPMDHWTDWSSQSESIHGINRDFLVQAGEDPHDAAEKINQALSGYLVLSDCSEYDSLWLNRLHIDTGIPMEFEIVSIYQMLPRQIRANFTAAKARAQKHLKLRLHRAENDALIQQHATKILIDGYQYSNIN